jgi:phospholipid/cholesterol/gamma-HCH transport system ATP-binding protein
MLQLQAVSKTLLGRRVLDHVDVDLVAGEIWGLVGTAGSGKSVLLKHICGLLRPDSGRVRVLGTDLGQMSEDQLQQTRSSIGMLFQNNALFDFMNVLQNVAFPLIRSGVSRAEADERAGNRLRAVGLSGSEKKHPSELSGGMKKRVALARAGINQPKLAIYDEPTAGLDPVTTSKIYDLLRLDQRSIGSTTVVVSSDVDALRSFAPRIGMLHEGRLLYDGPAAEMEHNADPVVVQFIRGDLEGPL